MNSIRKVFAIISLVALAFVIAACDNPFADDSDDSVDIETPDATEVADDAASDDAVVEEEPAEEATAEEEPTPTTEPQETATPDDAVATDDADDSEAVDNDAAGILEQAAERASELESARFELEGSGYIEIDEIGEISLSNAEGRVQRPDRAQIVVDVDTAIADIPIELLSVDGQLYFTDPVSGNWYEAPDDLQFSPGILFDEEQGLPALIRSVSNPELLGTEDFEGREAYKIYGIISQETINAGTGGVFRAEGDVDFNVWIDAETYDVLMVLAEDPTEETDSVWEMRIFDHNEPVDIDDPNGDDS